MTRDEIRTFFTQHVESWGRHDVAALVADYAEDCELVTPMFRTVRGRAGVETSYRDLFRAFADLTIEIDNLLIDHEGGDRAAYVFTHTCKHVGDILGYPASGRRVKIQGVCLFRLMDGKIVSERRMYDFTELLLQLGILKAKPANEGRG